MELEEALEILKITVKDNGTNNTKHIDLGLVPNSERPRYEEALKVAKIAIIKGQISQDEFAARINLI